MALSVEELAQIEAVLESPGAGAQTLVQLRDRFPALTFTRCYAADLGTEIPFRERQTYNLYLVDRVEHCWRITSDPAKATGIVVGAHKAGA